MFQYRHDSMQGVGAGLHPLTGTDKSDPYQHYVFDHMGKPSKTSSVGTVTLDGFSHFQNLLKPLCDCQSRRMICAAPPV